MSHPTEPQISVIIPTWNRRELLRNCLESLRAQTIPAEVVVVDNGSTDGTSAMVADEYAETQLIRNSKNLGFSQAVNLGISATTTPFLALLNNDTEADPRWIESGLNALMRQRDYGFFASRMINYHDRSRLDSAGDCYSRTGLPCKRGFGDAADRFGEREEVLGASAGAAFYRRELFETAGLFDEGYYLYLEDVELSLRAQLHGFRCLYLPEAVVYHIEAASDAGRTHPDCGPVAFYSSNRVFWITRNRWQLMVTYQPLRSLPQLWYGWTKSFLYHLLKAGFTEAFLKGLGAGIRLTPRALKRRMEMHRTRRLGPSQLCRNYREC